MPRHKHAAVLLVGLHSTTLSKEGRGQHDITLARRRSSSKDKNFEVVFYINCRSKIRFMSLCMTQDILRCLPSHSSLCRILTLGDIVGVDYYSNSSR